MTPSEVCQKLPRCAIFIGPSPTSWSVNSFKSFGFSSWTCIDLQGQEPPEPPNTLPTTGNTDHHKYNKLFFFFSSAFLFNICLAVCRMFWESLRYANGKLDPRYPATFGNAKTGLDFFVLHPSKGCPKSYCQMTLLFINNLQQFLLLLRAHWHPWHGKVIAYQTLDEVRKYRKVFDRKVFEEGWSHKCVKQAEMQ